MPGQVAGPREAAAGLQNKGQVRGARSCIMLAFSVTAAMSAERGTGGRLGWGSPRAERGRGPGMSDDVHLVLTFQKNKV